MTPQGHVTSHTIRLCPHMCTKLAKPCSICSSFDGPLVSSWIHGTGPIPVSKVKAIFEQVGFKPPPGMPIQEAFMLLMQLMQKQQSEEPPGKVGVPEEDITDPTNPMAVVRPPASEYLPDGAYELRALEPVGAEVIGLNLRDKPSKETLKTLQDEMSRAGFLVFRNQGILHGDEQVSICEYFGETPPSGGMPQYSHNPHFVHQVAVRYTPPTGRTPRHRIGTSFVSAMRTSTGSMGSVLNGTTMAASVAPFSAM